MRKIVWHVSALSADSFDALGNWMPPVKIKRTASRTNPVDGLEKNRDIKYVIDSIEKPKKLRTTSAGNSSFGVDQPSSWNAYITTSIKNAFDANVRKSKRSEVSQKLETLTPLTNCRCFARDTLSWDGTIQGISSDCVTGNITETLSLFAYPDAEYDIESWYKCHGSLNVWETLTRRRISIGL